MVNPKQGQVAVETSSGFTVVEIVDTVDLEVDDELAGDLESLGGGVLRLLPSGEKVDVFIQAIHASQEEGNPSTYDV
jgi:hypothetical protein